MKALILLSSERRNNSFTLRIARTFLSELQIEEAELLMLPDYQIHSCTGCLACQKSGVCTLRDDLEGILEKIRSADFILFASPVYLFSVSDRMKIFISRTVNYLHRDPQIRGKMAGIAVTADGLGGADAIRYLASYFSFTGLLYSGAVSCYIHEFRNYKKKNSRFQRELKKAVRRFQSIAGTREYSPTVSDYHYYYIRKRFTSAGRKRIPLEFPYWEDQGLFRRDYWNTTRRITGNPLIRIAGKLKAIFRIRGMF
jgi:multimeric flavodoxin WrbA